MLDELRTVRYGILEDFCRLPQEGDVVSWQRRLADAIINAEQLSKTRTADKRQLKQHRHLLRVIGNSLAYALLESHTIRTLSENRSVPASLSGQGADFDFVLETAQQLSDDGYIPIICDITTLLNVGDIVAWRPDEIVLVECKNSNRPEYVRSSGRLARQRESGKKVETYLRESRIEISEETTKIATPAGLPEPNWLAVEQLLKARESSKDGIAVMQFDDRDHLVAVGMELEDLSLLHKYFPDASGCKSPRLEAYGELNDYPDYAVIPPGCYPLSFEQRVSLLEREVFLFRFVDMAILDADFNHDGELIALEAYRESGGAFGVKINSEKMSHLSFASSLVNRCVWNPIPLAAMRNFLIEYSAFLFDRMHQEDSLDYLLPRAVGDNVRYGTAYKDGFME